MRIFLCTSVPRGKVAVPCFAADCRVDESLLTTSAILSISLLTSLVVSDAWFRTADVITSRLKSA